MGLESLCPLETSVALCLTQSRHLMPVYLVGHLQPAIHPKESWLRWVDCVGGISLSSTVQAIWRQQSDCLIYILVAILKRESSMPQWRSSCSTVCTVHCSSAMKSLLELGSQCGTHTANRSEHFLKRQMKWLDKRKAHRGKVVPWDYTAGEWQNIEKIKAPLLPSKYHTHQITPYFTLNFVCLSVLWIRKLALSFSSWNVNVAK